MASQIVGSSFANGAQFPNYVNGRVLDAEDLATGQATLCRRDEWTGQAAGTGVVSGLWVTASAATLTVASGLGITPSGEPVSLPAQVTLPLSIAGSPASPAGASFYSCATAPGSPQSAIGAGVYLLTALPACQLQGQAPVAPAPGSNAPACCTAQWEIEGIQFKAVQLPVGPTVNGVDLTPDNCRDLVAHWCYGTSRLAALGADPFNFVPPWTGLSQLSSTDLTPCDLPLCVFYWDGSQVSFVDNWSARRRVTRPDVSNAPWTAAVADERAAEGEARFLQFQDQVQDLASAGVTRATVAADVFGLLPPVGFLPVALDQTYRELAALQKTDLAAPASAVAGAGPAGPQAGPLYQPIDILLPSVIEQFAVALAQLGMQSGFVPSTFFGPLATFGGFVTWDMAYFALRQSYFMDAVPTASAAADNDAGNVTNANTTKLSAAANMRAVLQQTSVTTAARRVLARTATAVRYPIVLRAPIGSVSITPVEPQQPGNVPALFTYYFVTENVVAILNTLNGSQSSVTPYVVFIKDQFWPTFTRPPVISTLAQG